MIAAGRTQLPAEPPGYPLVGHLPLYQRDRLGFLLGCDDGSGLPVRLRLGRTAYLLTDAADIEHVLLRNFRNYSKTRRLTGSRGRRLLGRGLLTSTGAAHLERRRLLQPTFGRRQIGAYAGAVGDVAEEVAAGWTDGAVVDITAEMAALSRRVILRTLLGRHPDEAELERALAARERYLDYRFQSLLPLPEYVPRPVVLAHRRALRRIQAAFRTATVERRTTAGEPGDLLGHMVAARGPDGNGITDEAVLEEAVVLSVTGYETVAVALAWTWYLLALHPEVEAKVQRAADGRAHAYIETVLQEAMRLYPPTWIFVRVALEPDRLPSGVEIPAGAKLYLSQYVVHRSARYYREPEQFDPSRFEREADASRPEFAYFPFGGGVRLCIGKPLALLEGVLAVAALARRYRLLLEPGAPVAAHPGITLRPRGPLRMRVQVR